LIFAEINEMGSGSMLEGAIFGIESNYFQGRIADSSYKLEVEFGKGRRVVVGVNRFLEGNDDDSIDTLEITSADEERQLKRLEHIRGTRNQVLVDEVLTNLARDAADTSINLMPRLIEAVSTYATLGEIMAVLGGVFGRHIEVPSI
jgi:methylmalonyl-CoA mutase N-terminal domain/subunit